MIQIQTQKPRLNGTFLITNYELRITNWYHIAGNDEVELAYSLVAEFWGKGLATEMGEAILKVGFEQIGLPEIVCFTMTTNFASQRVMQKLGFQYERDIVHADLPHVFYRLKAPAK
ncbi:GNAT family N-acetyltransferase [Dendronalium sp. ChiSLP03b]|uniref:GNAT family N-acetyltransferase n=1 Tax=Dendronalium sp. ChiSLP03b TaxID=3075381 RepID=UPI002AD27981|nr:GNAT family N-acetyltransferase [Dendronalium sp. ChiSLP03b]MDZ8209481.1 GNAT family N-acetyltransferase [Dendronalium sp. ChiSLP03b]